MRKVLTGTKYGIKNPKVVSMGLGKAGAVSAAKQGGILTIVLLSTYRVIDYFLTDEATLIQLIGTLGTDIVKVGVTTGASVLIATAFGASTIAVGPIIAVVVIGFGVSTLLEHVDNRWGITNRVIAGLEELDNQARVKVLDVVEQMTHRVIDYAAESVRLVMVTWINKTLHEYLSPFTVRR